jgi:MoaA/NifB/PqqE/SkfB family radical SAM enzyme
MEKMEPFNNIFKTISVQTTYKCQMKCANCYLGDMLNNNKYKDVDLLKFEKAINQLPNRCDIRFIGAEPTLNPNLFELVSVARAAGHRPSLLTNGLKLRNYEYAKALKEAGINMLGISMNGCLEDELYQLMDNGKYAKQKMIALENCFKFKIMPHINVILVPENVHAVSKLVQYIEELRVKYNFKKYPVMIRFKSVGQVGNYMKTITYDLNQMIQILNYRLGGLQNISYKINGCVEKNTCTFKLKSGLLGKITDWTLDDEGIPDAGSTRRGILTNDYKIEPFFEYYSSIEDAKWK